MMVSARTGVSAENLATEEDRRYRLTQPGFYIKPLVWRTTTAYRQALGYVGAAQGLVWQVESSFLSDHESREQFNHELNRARNVAYFLPDAMREDIADRICALLREGIQRLQ